MASNPSAGAMVGFGVKLGGGPPEPHQPHIPIESAQDRLDAERTFGRQLRLGKGYVGAAAQPTYGFMAFEPVVSGRVQEVLFLSIWGTDPFSTVATVRTPLNASQSGGAAALNPTLGAAAGATTYVTGFEITGGGATAATTVQALLSTLAGGNMQYTVVVPAGATTSIQFVPVSFNPPLAAAGVNQSITLDVPSFGVGNTVATAAIHGYRETTAQSLAGSAVGFISTYVPQDSNVEPPIPNLVLQPSTLPAFIAPSRRQILMWPNERFIIAFKGLANGAQLQASLSVVEYEMASFLKGLVP